MLSDQIADMLIRIQNAYMSQKETVEVSYSKINEELTLIMVKEGFIEKVTKGPKNKNLLINLLYKNKKSPIQKIKRISKPSIRVYVKKNQLAKYLIGISTVILSTPKGIMTVRQAKKLGLGGEVICKIS